MSPRATKEELMIIAVAREIKDYERVLLGAASPPLAAAWQRPPMPPTPFS